MKNYSRNRAQKGKTGYRTPSRWLAGSPEAFKRRMPSKLSGKHINQIKKQSAYFKKSP